MQSQSQQLVSSSNLLVQKVAQKNYKIRPEYTHHQPSYARFLENQLEGGGGTGLFLASTV